MSTLPPRHLCIAGALFIAAGVGSVTKMITEGLEGRLSSFDIGFVMIPIGYGILLGRASSRKWALAFALTCLFAIVGAGGCMAYEQWADVSKRPCPDCASTWYDLILAATFCLYQALALTRSGHREWFAAEKGDRAAVKSLAWAVAVVATVLFSSLLMAEWRARKTFEQLYSFHVRIVPCDSENGKGLTSISLSSDAFTHAADTQTKLPRATDRTFSGPDGIQWELNGIAAQPFQMTLHSDGYEDKTITVGRDSDKTIRVPMQPLVAAKPKRDADGKPAAPVVKE